MRLLCLALLFAQLLAADARYKLAYHAKANPLIQMVAGLAGVTRMSSDGDEVLLKGSRMLVKGEKSTIFLNYATGEMMLIDHNDRTFERLRIEDMRKRIEADIPSGLIDGLKRLFPGGGGGMATAVKVERLGDPAKQKSLEAFRLKHGLSYLLPAMESLIGLLPGIQKAISELRAGGDLVQSLRIQIGAEGRIVDAVVDIRDYREAPVSESEFAPPQGYTEVK